MMSAHFINLPPPPSDPVTPSEMGPGTPNSTTTSMSELSTVAIKDGHRGHLSHHHSHHPSSHHSPPSERTLDAERADRISRLAGLERVPRNTNTPLSSSSLAANIPPSGGSSNLTPGTPAPVPPAGYFDSTNNPTYSTNPTTAPHKERSTVGSASATASLAGGRTWASGSDTNDPDKMSTGVSEDMESAPPYPYSATASSAGDMADVMSEEGNASLVGFGEGASSTISGPVSSRDAVGVRMSQMGGGRGGEGREMLTAREKMIDGMTYDRGVVDTVTRTPEMLNQNQGGMGSGIEWRGVDEAERRRGV